MAGGMGKTVVVTGGCVGIGATISSVLAAAGWEVARTSSRRGAGAEIHADLSTPEGVDEAAKAVFSHFDGGPQAIVNNAALFSGGEDAINCSIVVATAKFIEGFRGLPSAEGAPARTLVNIIDAAVMRPGFEPRTAYEKAKRRVALWTEGALDPARRFRVVGVAPGPVSPPPCGGVKAPPCPFGRPSAADVASAVLFLLESPRIAGCIKPVDGGSRLV